jgi:hypothetical protein
MLPPMELMSAVGIIGPRLMRKSKKPDISLIPKGTELYAIYMAEESESDQLSKPSDKFSIISSHNPKNIGFNEENVNKTKKKVGIYLF